MKDIFKVLGKARIFSFSGLFAMISSILKLGINLQSLVRVAAKIYPEKIGLVFEDREYTFRELYENINKLKVVLYQRYHLRKKQRIAIVCSNHPSFVLSLFAASGLALDVYLLSCAISESQFVKLVERHKFDFLIYDPQIENYIKSIGYENRSLSSLFIEESLELPVDVHANIGRSSFNKIVVLTSGTTGISTAASRKVSFFAYLSPLIALTSRLGLFSRRSLYIGTPMYHGFGLVTLLISIALGKKVFISSKFDPVDVGKVIQKNKIDCITLVPTMLYRLMAEDVESLQSLRCIVSGGSALPSAEVQQVQSELGNILFNIYGSSEAGISIMASPHDLLYSDKTIGKVLSRVQVIIADEEGDELPVDHIGHIMVKSSWSVAPDQWIKTGDMGYVDCKGYFYLVGRVDDMIISGGENVFPSELENVLRSHPLVKNVSVIGIDDRDMGQRLKAFVVANDNVVITEMQLKDWLRTRVARYQVPREIDFVKEIPLNQLGKVDKIALQTNSLEND